MPPISLRDILNVPYSFNPNQLEKTMETIKRIRYVTAEEAAGILGIQIRQFKRLLKDSRCPLLESRISRAIEGKKRIHYLYPEKTVVKFKESRALSRKLSKKDLEIENQELKRQVDVLRWVLGPEFPGTEETKHSAAWFEERALEKYDFAEKVLRGLNLDIEELRDRIY